MKRWLLLGPLFCFTALTLAQGPPVPPEPLQITQLFDEPPSGLKWTFSRTPLVYADGHVEIKWTPTLERTAKQWADDNAATIASIAAATGAIAAALGKAWSSWKAAKRAASTPPPS